MHDSLKLSKESNNPKSESDSDIYCERIKEFLLSYEILSYCYEGAQLIVPELFLLS